MELLVTLFLCGDVMTGRGIDQILPHPGDPTLHESFVRNARQYVELAERENGRIEKPVDFAYIWGDALEVLERIQPDLRIINLETSVTISDNHWRGKGIHYRMHPHNAKCLTAADIDCCVLANNHVLDWGYGGLVETIETLEGLNIAPVGAGRNAEATSKPTVLNLAGSYSKTRVIIFAYGSPTAGVSEQWAPGRMRPGVNLLTDLSDKTCDAVCDAIRRQTRDGDVVIFSVHWGGNWGYEISDEQQRFARRLIDRGGVDVVYGHSSHHVKGIEVYRDRLILYGCGDFLNDYEGIGGHEGFRPDLTLMYLPTLDAETGALKRLRLVPMQVKRMRLNHADQSDAVWLGNVLTRLSVGSPVRYQAGDDGVISARWPGRE